MSDFLVAPSAQARFVVTLPPEPSVVGAELSKLAGEMFISLTNTKDAFAHLAKRAKEQLVILTPYIDAAGAEWAADLFLASKAVSKILILRGLAQLEDCGPHGQRAKSLATELRNYQITTETGVETFHAKIVLADGIAAYVGSANFLYRSREKNLECGFLLEGHAVVPVQVLISALLEATKRSASESCS